MGGKVVTNRRGKAVWAKRPPLPTLGYPWRAWAKSVVIDADIGLRNLDVIMGLENASSTTSLICRGQEQAAASDDQAQEIR